MRYLFDIETDALLKECTKVHILAMVDVDSGEEYVFGPEEIDRGLEKLYEADEVIGHNIIAFDLPALRKLKGWAPRPGCNRIDTMLFARHRFADIAKEDRARVSFEKEDIGSHSLRAWGRRLGEYKGDFSGPWEEWTQEMQDYCVQDVRVNLKLLQHLKPWEYPRVPLELETRFAEIAHEMEVSGWLFDRKKAQDLYVEFCSIRDKLQASLVERFGSWQEVAKQYVAKKDNAKRGIKKGELVTNYKMVTFNPGSRVHIEKKLRELGWTPKEFTEGGRAKLDEEILEKIDIPEAKQLIEFLLIQKRLGQLGDGDNAWLNVVDDRDLIHGRMNTAGAVTGRVTHFSPNISQVPSVRAIYGKECRGLFTTPSGWALVGADQSGLELRTFAHYLAFYDNGEYAKVVTEGDVHTHNQLAAGLPTRDNAKTFIYGLIYGAGDQKLGTIVKGTAKHGKSLRSKFLKQVPAYAKLKTVVAQAAKRGWVKGLDGRHIKVRSEHAALNSLLQGAGAILCKQWLVDVYDDLLSKGFTHGYSGDFVVVGYIHDEIQIACKQEIAEVVGGVLRERGNNVGSHFDFKVPLNVDYKIGKNWSDTH